MSELKAGLLRFRAYGPQADEGGSSGEVSAAVFADRLSALVKALTAADKALNGFSAHEYTIAKLHTSDPTALIREVVSPNFSSLFTPKSGLDGFAECAEAVKIGSSKAISFGKCAQYIAKASRPAKRGLAYSAVWTKEDNPIRLDAFLAQRAALAIAPEISIKATHIGHEWFKGSVIGSFDGRIDVVNARGALPQVQLTLTAGGEIIDCVCRSSDIEAIGASLKKRVRITGKAIYDGSGGLPIRVEVFEIVPVKTVDGFEKWKAAFKPFDVPEWEGDE